MIIRCLSISLVFCLLSFSQIGAQQWVLVDDRSVTESGQRDIVPGQYKTYQIDANDIHRVLWSAPEESEQDIAHSKAILTVGLADGKTDDFRIVRYDMMEQGLAEKYPQIRTFRGISVSDPFRTIRADWTTEGFRALIRDENGSMFIDPLQRNDVTHCIVYFKKDFANNRAWECGVTEAGFAEEDLPQQRVFGDCQFRSYRLAMAATGEYSNFFGATSSAQSALVLSQVVTAVDRINDVFEADLTVRLILIANTDAVFYYNPATDPYSGDACTHLGQNQTTITNVIGSANYDIGHVFSVGSGGCAGGVICDNTNKAKGATGWNPPTGDAFYIDFVAHEIGHQFGADHTFNGTEGFCSGNRVSTSAYEPGSGSTIMAYGGFCGVQDVQPHSDAYFHARSLLQISNILTSTSCAAFITLNNQAPVAGSPANHTIPISTPFILTAIATDADNDPLKYCWEQYNLESISSEPPTSTDTLGPVFRSLNSTTSTIRYFPKIGDIVQNVSSPWEVLPSVSRTMTFKMTVRDFHNGTAGCTDDDDVLITTSSTSGPFLVTSQNISISWPQTSTQTITWNVANTTVSPVNCSNVEIRLSIDGGFTYPTVLSASTINDGVATIVVPNVTTTTGRIRVKSVNNIFFDINNANISISPPAPTFIIAVDPAYISGCNTGSVTTLVQTDQFMGYSTPITLSALNLPPGAIATFNPSVVTPGSSSTLTLSNLSGLSGLYSPIIRGTSNAIIKELYFYINLLLPPTVSPTLTSPTNAAMDVVINPLLDWQTASGSFQYEYQVAYNIDFSAIAISGIVGTDKVQVLSGLIVNQIYYWRVRGLNNNNCGDGPWSSIFSFTTGTCFATNSINVPIVIPEAGTPLVTSTFTNNIGMTIADVNVINLAGAHSWVNDLQFTLISPQGTNRLVWNQPCADQDSFNINFDDEAANSNWPCPPVDGLNYKPSNSLTVFDGQQAQGLWTLQIQDVADGDGGSLDSWGLKVCGTITCQLVVNLTTGTGVGTLPAAISCALPGDTVIISSLLAGQTINVGASAIQITKNIVLLAQGANTNITGNGMRVFNVNGGKQLECIGVKITAGTALTGAAIINSGTLKLKNTNIKKNPSVSGASLIQNNPGSTVNLVGTCNINQ